MCFFCLICVFCLCFFFCVFCLLEFIFCFFHVFFFLGLSVSCVCFCSCFLLFPFFLFTIFNIHRVSLGPVNINIYTVYMYICVFNNHVVETRGKSLARQRDEAARGIKEPRPSTDKIEGKTNPNPRNFRV